MPREPGVAGAPAAGVLLAGGLSRRMGGGDKALRALGGETILARVIARARPQVGALVLNANGDPGRFAEYGLPVVADVVGGFAGPLAAHAMSAPSRPTASTSRAATSRGTNGASVAKLATHAHPGASRAAHSMPVSTPASGPAKPSTTSPITGSP